MTKDEQIQELLKDIHEINTIIYANSIIVGSLNHFKIRTICSKHKTPIDAKPLPRDTKYQITERTPREGDYAININKANAKPRKVFRNSFGYLGFPITKPGSWFKWKPLNDNYKKILILN